MSTTAIALAGAASVSGGGILYWLGIRKPEPLLPEEQGRYRIRDDSRLRAGSETRVYVEKLNPNGSWVTLKEFDGNLFLRSRKDKLKEAQEYLLAHIQGKEIKDKNVVFDTAFDPVKQLTKKIK